MATSVELTSFTPPRQVRVQAKLNLRATASSQSARIGRFEPGQVLNVAGVADGEQVLNNALWYRLAERSGYVWSGGAELLDAPSQPPAAGESAPQVSRRANGSILPLSAAEIEPLYGRFTFEPLNNGAVRITDPDWARTQLVAFEHELLRALTPQPPLFHRRAAPWLRRALDAIQASGLGELLLTFDGSFVSRFKNWDPRSGLLSSHSWGIALDLNARFNAARQVPALPGQPGCLRPLVEHFAAQGFAWGGHFSSPLDGMHFELARRDLD